MRDQRDRDAVTIEITKTLLIFVLVLAIGAAPAFLVSQFIGEGAVRQTLPAVVLLCATGAAFAYLWRHRRP